MTQFYDTSSPAARTNKRSASAVDTYVGQRILDRRQLIGMTQREFAEALDLSYQQIQKYEAGKSRVSAGRLYEMAQALQVPVQYFFEGCDDSAGYFAPPKLSTNEAKIRQYVHEIRDPRSIKLIPIIAQHLYDAEADQDIQVDI